MDSNLVKSVYTDVKKIMGDKQLDAVSALSFTVKLMELVEKYKTLEGKDKKNLVLQVLKLLVDDSNLSDDEQDKLDIILGITVPYFIDMIVAASQGSLALNKVSKWCCKS